MRTLTLPLLALLPSCASILTPMSFAVPVDSSPQGADVLVEGHLAGVTPCVVNLPRWQGPTLSLRLDGYHPHHVAVGNVPAPMGAVLLDIVLLPLLIIDVATNVDGAICDEPILVHLHPNSERPPVVWRREDYDPNARVLRSGGAVVIIPPAIR